MAQLNQLGYQGGRPRIAGRVRAELVPSGIGARLWEHASLSVIATDDQTTPVFIDHASGVKATRSGNPSLRMLGEWGPAYYTAVNTATLSWANKTFAANSPMTFGCIFQSNSFAANFNLFTMSKGAPNNGEPRIIIASGGELQWNRIGQTSAASGITLSANVPYFVGVTVKNGFVVDFLVKNLTSGRLSTATASAGGNASAGEGTFVLWGFEPGSFGMVGFGAAAHVSADYIGTDGLMQWAFDPWAPWRQLPRVRMVGVAQSSGTFTIDAATLTATSGTLTASDNLPWPSVWNAVTPLLDGMLTDCLEGGFLKIHDAANPIGAKLADVLASGSQLVSAGDNGPTAIFSAWPSFSVDTRRGKTWHYGGGHANYYGNDTYFFNLQTLEWERASLTTQMVQTDPSAGVGPRLETADGPFKSPVSSHTGDGNWYARLFDLHFTWGGANQYTGTNYRIPEADAGGEGPNTTGPYTFDPALADPDKVAGDTGTAPSAPDVFVSRYDGWSATTWTPATGTGIAFTLTAKPTSHGLSAGQAIRIYEVADPTNYALGTVNSYTSGAPSTSSLTLDITSLSGSGAQASSWRVVREVNVTATLDAGVDGTNAWANRRSVETLGVGGDYQGGTHMEVIDGVQRAFRIFGDGGDLYRYDFPDVSDETQDSGVKVGNGTGYSGQGCLAYSPTLGTNGGGLALKTAGSTEDFVWWDLNPIGGAAVTRTIVAAENITMVGGTLNTPAAAYWTVSYDPVRERFLLFAVLRADQLGLSDDVGDTEVWEIEPPSSMGGVGTYGRATKLTLTTSAPDNPAISGKLPADGGGGLAGTGRYAGLLGRARYVERLDVWVIQYDHRTTSADVWIYKPDPWSPNYVVEAPTTVTLDGHEVAVDGAVLTISQGDGGQTVSLDGDAVGVTGNALAMAMDMAFTGVSIAIVRNHLTVTGEQIGGLTTWAERNAARDPTRRAFKGGPFNTRNY